MKKEKVLINQLINLYAVGLFKKDTKKTIYLTVLKRTGLVL